MTSQEQCREIEFHIEAPSGLPVFVAGSFNEWDPLRDRLEEQPAGGYATTLRLPPGRYEYKFVMGDLWCKDPRNPDVVADGYGSVNSVVTVE